MLPRENFWIVTPLSPLFLGFWVIQTGYWPVPFSSDEALQLGKVFSLLKYLYYEKSDRCGSAPVILRVLLAVPAPSISNKPLAIRVSDYVFPIFERDALRVKALNEG